MRQATIRTLASDYTAAWNSLDPDRMAAHFSAEGSLTINGGTPAVGRAAISQAAADYMSSFPDMHLTMDSVTATSEGAVYYWTFVGTNTGPGGTGRPVKFSGYEEWTLTPEGLIATSLGHYDAADYARQVGTDSTTAPATISEPLAPGS